MSKVVSSTFTAELNGENVSMLFHAAANTAETVAVPLRPGVNELMLSVNGRVQKKTVKDTHLFAFIVAK